MRQTEKKYYQYPYLKSCKANIFKIHPESIELDITVAFPEGGGQEADHGIINTPIGSLRFINVKNIYGESIYEEHFKGVKVGGIILHIIHPDDLEKIQKLEPGMIVNIQIDVDRRAKLTLSHSASHFLYAAVIEHYPFLKEKTIGCHIKENSARFDFITDIKFNNECIKNLCTTANTLIEKNLPIEISTHPEFIDARYWTYGSISIPCGGTHLEKPKPIGAIIIRRKNIGKDKERLICEFPNSYINIEEYYSNELIGNIES